jgi:hypothetical protein
MPWSPATPGHWLILAADARALAEQMAHSRARRQMLLIARGYEKLAEHAARVERMNLPVERADNGPSIDPC